jgi:hypothetical protein
MILSIYSDDLREAHQFQGLSNDCGPFCAAIVSNALKGTSLWGDELAIEMNKPYRWGFIPIPRRIFHWATFPWGVVNVLKSNGLAARWKMFKRAKDLQENLGNGIVPVVIIGSWRPLWSHYKILVAHDETKGWGFVDPAQMVSEIFWDSDGEFMKLWKNLWRMTILVDPTS